MAEKKSSQILLSSSLATTIVAVVTNPLDVIKVRIQNGSKYCSLPNHSQCITQTPHNGPTASLQQASIYRLLAAKNLQEQYKVLCDCVPFRSNTKALIYIIRKEGFRTLTNGMIQGMMGANLSMGTYLFCYEGVRSKVKQYTSHSVAIPLASALIARTITTCVAFPFEYWRTLQQSVTGVNHKSGFQLGMRVSSGFFSLLLRDLLFSGLYWVLVENIRREVKSWRQHHDEGYLDKTNLFLSNVIAGSVSGAICAAVTTPLDIVKTRRQLHPDEYKKRSTFSVLREIYTNEGKEALTAGLRQRVTRVMIGCAGILTLYEFFSDILKDDILTS